MIVNATVWTCTFCQGFALLAIYVIMCMCFDTRVGFIVFAYSIYGPTNLESLSHNKVYVPFFHQRFSSIVLRKNARRLQLELVCPKAYNFLCTMMYSNPTTKVRTFTCLLSHMVVFLLLYLYWNNECFSYKYKIKTLFQDRHLSLIFMWTLSILNMNLLWDAYLMCCDINMYDVQLYDGGIMQTMLYQIFLFTIC